MDLGETLVRIIDYEDICKKYKFVPSGNGTIPWSNCFKKEDGNCIDIAKNNWILYDTDREILDEGYTPDELRISLKLISG
jgi:hypothetical protein